MNRHRMVSCFVLGAGLLLAGCSTISTRISCNQSVFDAATAEQQEQIRAGRIGIGFTKPMVRMALGQPDRVSTRVDATGSSEIWTYMKTYYTTTSTTGSTWCGTWPYGYHGTSLRPDGTLSDNPYPAGARGYHRRFYDSFYYSNDGRSTLDSKITFQNEKVVSFEAQGLRRR